MKRMIYKGHNLKTPVEIATKVSDFNCMGQNHPTQLMDGFHCMSYPGNTLGQVGLHTMVDDVIDIVRNSTTEADAYTALMCYFQGIERPNPNTCGGGLVFEEIKLPHL